MSSEYVETQACGAALPPRKRAKTEEEKEQRRVERILRNRRAAHALREKKRRHVEYLEAYVQQLEQQLAFSQENQAVLMELCAPSAEVVAKLHTPQDLSEFKTNCSLTLTGVGACTDSDSAPAPKRACVDLPLEGDETLLLPASPVLVPPQQYSYLSPVSITLPLEAPELKLEAFDLMPAADEDGFQLFGTQLPDLSGTSTAATSPSHVPEMKLEADFLVPDFPHAPAVGVAA